MEALLMEKSNLKVVAGPVDLNDAAVTGARVSMAQGERVSFVLQMGASTAAVVQLALKQHNAAVSGTTKVLNIQNAYFKKVGAATTFTKVDAPGTDTLDLSTDFAASSGIVVIEVLQEDLDVNNGFTHVSLNIADSTAAKLGSCLAQVSMARTAPAYSQAI